VPLDVLPACDGDDGRQAARQVLLIHLQQPLKQHNTDHGDMVHVSRYGTSQEGNHAFPKVGEELVEIRNTTNLKQLPHIKIIFKTIIFVEFLPIHQILILLKAKLFIGIYVVFTPMQVSILTASTLMGDMF